jgi:beta-glucosidase-like glycosyl hydrolase
VGIYNIGGGAGWRLTNWELQTRTAGALGVVDVRGWYERNWFATRSFHGQWYSDSDRLHELVAFRRDTFDAALARAARAQPVGVRLAGRIPLDEAVVDSAVARMLALTGLVAGAPVPLAVDEATVATHHALARELAAECAVLVKNDGRATA